MGLSYAAHTQGALGSAGAPGVAAMFLDSGGFSNAYQGGIRQGGAFELKQATWAFNQALESPEIQRDPAKLAAMKAIDIRDWFRRMPWRRGNSPVTLAPEYEDYLFEQWEHGDFDDYWKQLGIYAEGFYDQYVDAAMVHMSSWFDAYARTATDNYIGLSKRKRGPVRLIMGPWTHGDRQLTYVGDVDFGPNATLDGNVATDFLTLRLRWFDRWLKGIEQRRRRRAERFGSSSWAAAPAGRTRPAGSITAGAGARSATGRSPTRDGRRTTAGAMARSSTDASPTERDAWREYRFDPAPSGADDRRDRHVGAAGDGGRRVRPARRCRGSSGRRSRIDRWPSGRTCWCSRRRRSRATSRSRVRSTAKLWISSDCPDTDSHQARGRLSA